MPKRTDIESILIIGAGPIVIGQSGEFDYAGSQACKTLKNDGYRIILVNSNPATIMTDPEFSDATYIEPITASIVEKIIAKERPDAILPTMGGQTALNCTMQLADTGVLNAYNVELIGAKRESIRRAEERKLFCQAMDKIGLKYPTNTIVSSEAEIEYALELIGLPAIIRPSFTLGGMGGGVTYNKEEFYRVIRNGLRASPISEVQVDKSVIGWKEFEMEVVRDNKDNCIIVCSIENIDAMGIHTGDSITVAPALTLRDEEYQNMRNASIAVLREIGIDTGGSNVQFAFNPNKDNEMVVIEMNPRVSRSSALASKATGFPIAKIAAKLAVGYTLDELVNDCTPALPASFEPTIDYIVTKIPRFNFNKFPGADQTLTSSMKSVGEVMSIGHSFQDSIMRALCSLETDLTGFDEFVPPNSTQEQVKAILSKWIPERILVVADAIRYGISLQEIADITHYNIWFIRQIKHIVDAEMHIIRNGLPQDFSGLIALKAQGFSDARLARLANCTVNDVESLRIRLGIHKTYHRIDTCAGEFHSDTAYMYGCYEQSTTMCEANPTNRKKVIILGSGPNRVGQGIEFDYTCVNACYTIANMGYETIMVNCNPETVSTDYDTSNRLYFVPLTREEVFEIIRKEQENGTLIGVIVQLGGQTPLKLAKDLEEKGVKILGTQFNALDIAEDRMRFQKLIANIGLKQPNNCICNQIEQVILEAEAIGYPVVVRPSYVLGGQNMKIVHDRISLQEYLMHNFFILENGTLLIDKFLANAIEVDVDAICDGCNVLIAGIMEHIEEAGIHSGDSACSLPVYTLSKDIVEKLQIQTKKVAVALNVVGFINIQFAVKDSDIYILEVNPRASRTIPFVSKAHNIPYVAIATQTIMGCKLPTLPERKFKHVAVKEAVFSFSRFPGVDVILGPEMKSTGEVMGLDKSFEVAFAKAQIATSSTLPLLGTVLLSVKDADKEALVDIARTLIELGFELIATRNTAKYLTNHSIKVTHVNKVSEGRPHIVDLLQDKMIALVINTSEGAKSIEESKDIRRTALYNGVPYNTTIRGAKATVMAIKYLKNCDFNVRSLQEYSKD